MPVSNTPVTTVRRAVPTRNLIVLGAGVAAIAAGYLALMAGHPSAGAVLLVLGYCVLVPLGIAL